MYLFYELLEVACKQNIMLFGKRLNLLVTELIET